MKSFCCKCDEEEEEVERISSNGSLFSAAGRSSFEGLAINSVASITASIVVAIMRHACIVAIALNQRDINII